MLEKWSKIVFGSIGLSLLVAGCSDSEDSGKNIVQSDDDVIETFDDLPKCTNKSAGRIVTVTKDEVDYICNASLREWVETVTKFRDLPSCTKKRENDVFYVVRDEDYYYCTSSEWLTEEEINTPKSSSDKEDRGDGDSGKSSVSSKSSSSGKSSSSVKSSSSGKSSSSVKSSDNGKSSSSVKSSASGKSSSSVKSSDSVKSSSSGKSSSSVKLSSSEELSSSSSAQVTTCNSLIDSKAAWQYLNPAISYGEMIDARDCQVYKTVLIGSQTWMAENLNYETEGSWCSKGCVLYGRHYYHESAITACPEGFHLPTNDEFITLAKYIGNDAKKLRATDGWSKENGSDVYGFSALPAGFCSQSSCADDWWESLGYDSSQGQTAGFWLASCKDAPNVIYNDDPQCFFSLDFDSGTVNDKDHFNSYGNNKGASIRCVKDFE